MDSCEETAENCVRRIHAAFMPKERKQAEHSERQASDGQRAPTRMGTLQASIEKCHKTDARKKGAHEINSHGPDHFDRKTSQTQNHDENRNRKVDEEDPAPAKTINQYSTGKGGR